MIRKITQCGLMSALAIAVSLLERLIPLQALVPVPGIKLGLSNCIILFVLIKLDFKSAFSVMLVKCAVVAAFFTGFTSFVYSFSGGALAIIGMYLLLKMCKVFSLYGVSVAGACLHSTGQILAAALMLKSVYIFNYLPVLLLVSVFTGIIIAVLTNLILKRVEVLK